MCESYTSENQIFHWLIVQIRQCDKELKMIFIYFVYGEEIFTSLESRKME